MTRLALVLLVVTQSASATIPLKMQQAREATRLAAKPLADFIDAKAVHVTACHRLRTNRIDCVARIYGTEQTCRFRAAVIRGPHWYVVHGRDLRCWNPPLPRTRQRESS